MRRSHSSQACCLDKFAEVTEAPALKSERNLRCLPLLEYDGRIHPFWPLGSGCPPWPWGIWSMSLSWPFSGTCTTLSQAFEGAKLHEKAAVPEILCAAVMSNQQVLCRPAAFKKCQQD